MQSNWPVLYWKELGEPCTPQARANLDGAVEEVVNTLRRNPWKYSVAVSGSGEQEHYCDQAWQLGREIALAGKDLLSGGLGGLMFHSTRGFLEARCAGTAIGIIPGDPNKAKAAKDLAPKIPGVKQVFTNLSGPGHKGPTSRNNVLIGIASRVVLMPGGVGSRAEAELAVRCYRKPVIAFDPGGNNDNKDYEDWRAYIRGLSIPVIGGLSEAFKDWLRFTIEPLLGL